MGNVSSDTMMIIIGVCAAVAFILIFIVYWKRKRGKDDEVGYSSDDYESVSGGLMREDSGDQKEKVVYNKSILDFGFIDPMKCWMKLSGGKTIIICGANIPLREIDIGEFYLIELSGDDEGYILEKLQKVSSSPPVKKVLPKPIVKHVEEDEDEEDEGKSDGEPPPRVVRRTIPREQTAG